MNECIEGGGEIEVIGNSDELCVPRGGPICVPNMVSSLTSVSLFQSSLLQALQDLEVEVDDDDEEEDISVDELKIFADEELVDMAMKEAFEIEELEEKGLTLSIYTKNKERIDNEVAIRNNGCLKINGGKRNGSTGSMSIVNTNKSNSSNKRKRPGNLSSEEIAKVEEIAKIKKKQDEDKAAVRLHSYNPSCQVVECAVPSSEGTQRMKPLRAATAGFKVKSSRIHEHVSVIHPELVLTVEVYHNVKKWIKTQEFLVLGRQLLSELRDKIYCITDQVMQKAGHDDPSGYFLIEEVFCNDMRDPSAVDYSEPIFDWLINKKDEAIMKWDRINSGDLQQKQKAVIGDVSSQLPHFRAVEMQNTLFSDLKFCIGAGYLYCHQGQCKHTIVIRDMRLLHDEDVQNRAAYPIPVFQMRQRVRKCYVCRIYRATKVTVDDKWAQANPCYFCDNCYYLLHYKDGSLVYTDFSVYDYLHD